jgi:hypothetical protein
MWYARERREMCTGFWWEIPREKPLESPRRRWEYGVKLDLREIGWGGVGWIHLAKVIGGLL